MRHTRKRKIVSAPALQYSVLCFIKMLYFLVFKGGGWVWGEWCSVLLCLGFVWGQQVLFQSTCVCVWWLILITHPVKPSVSTFHFRVHGSEIVQVNLPPLALQPNTHTHTNTKQHIHTYRYINTHARVHTHMRKCVSVCVCLCVCKCMCVSVCVYLCVSVCVCVRTYLMWCITGNPRRYQFLIRVHMLSSVKEV